jgi:hypothetical protein
MAYSIHEAFPVLQAANKMTAARGTAKAQVSLPVNWAHSHRCRLHINYVPQ